MLRQFLLIEALRFFFNQGIGPGIQFVNHRVVLIDQALNLLDVLMLIQFHLLEAGSKDRRSRLEVLNRLRNGMRNPSGLDNRCGNRPPDDEGDQHHRTPDDLPKKILYFVVLGIQDLLVAQDQKAPVRAGDGLVEYQIAPAPIFEIHPVNGLAKLPVDLIPDGTLRLSRQVVGIRLVDRILDVGRVLMILEFCKSEDFLSLFVHGDDVPLGIGQKDRAPDRQGAFQKLCDEYIQSDIRSGHPFEEAFLVDRNDAGYHPSLACGVQVGVGPDRLFPGIVLGVGQVVEVVVAHRKGRSVLLRRINHEGVESVHVVPGVQIDLGDQRIVVHQGLEGGIEVFGQKGLASGIVIHHRIGGVVKGRASVVRSLVVDSVFGHAKGNLILWRIKIVPLVVEEDDLLLDAFHGYDNVVKTVGQMAGLPIDGHPYGFGCALSHDLRDVLVQEVHGDQQNAGDDQKNGGDCQECAADGVCEDQVP